jgi:hypothetical protein
MQTKSKETCTVSTKYHSGIREVNPEKLKATASPAFARIAGLAADHPKLSIQARGAAIALFGLGEHFSREQAKRHLRIGEHVFWRIARELKEAGLLQAGKTGKAGGEGYRLIVERDGGLS